MENFSPSSRVWVYQADRALNENEVSQINIKATSFIADWTAHGKLLKSHLEIFYNRFLVLFVDESQAGASGCGIDKSVHFIQQLEKDFNLNLMNRLLVAYKQAEEVKSCSLHSFEKGIESGEITASTIVFNNLVTTKQEFDTNWEIPLHQSWHNKMLVH